MHRLGSQRRLWSAVAVSGNAVTAAHSRSLRTVSAFCRLPVTAAGVSVVAVGCGAVLPRSTVFAAAPAAPITQALADRQKLMNALADNINDIDESLEGWSREDLALALGVMWTLAAKQGTEPLKMPKYAKDVSNDVPRLKLLHRLLLLSDAAYLKNEKQWADTVSNCDLVSAVWRTDATDFKQAHYFAVDHETKSVVLVLRGSYSADDAVICSFMAPTHLELKDEGLEGWTHRGCFNSANQIREHALRGLQDLMDKHPSYEPVLTGHSLGGGTASVLSLLLKKDIPSLRTVVYNAPPVLSASLADAVTNQTSVVYGDDLVSRANLASFEKLRADLADFDWKSAALSDLQRSRLVTLAKDLDGRIRQRVSEHVSTVKGHVSAVKDQIDKVGDAVDETAQKFLEAVEELKGSASSGDDGRGEAPPPPDAEKLQLDALQSVSKSLRSEPRKEAPPKPSLMARLKRMLGAVEEQTSKPGTEAEARPATVDEPPVQKKKPSTAGKDAKILFHTAGTLVHIVPEAAPTGNPAVWDIGAEEDSAHLTGFILKPTLLQHHFASEALTCMGRILDAHG